MTTAIIVSRVFRSWAALIILLACLPGPGHAQTIEIPAPPVRSSVDELGVDMTSGELLAPGPGLSIGSADSGMTFRQSWAGGWRHNYVVRVTGTTINNQNYLVVGSGEQSVMMELDSGTWGTNGVYKPTTPDGSKLVETTTDFTFTDRNGTVITFTKIVGDYYGGDTGAVGTLVVAPTGERTTLTYKNDGYEYCTEYEYIFDPPYVVCVASVMIYMNRLQSVTKNTGHQLKFEYMNNNLPAGPGTWNEIQKVTAINNAVDYCSPTADSCSGLTQTWPSLSYGPVSGNYKVIDPVGRQTGYTFGYLSGVVKLVGIRRPEASSDNVTIAYDANNLVDSITFEGLTRDYSMNVNSFADLLTVSWSDSLGRSRSVDSTIGYSNTYQKGFVRKDTDAGSNDTVFTPNTNGSLYEVTAPEGNKVRYTYDARGNVTETRAIAKVSGPSNIVVTASFDSTCTVPAKCNKPNSVTDARGKTTDYTYETFYGTGALFTATAPSVADPGGGSNRPTTTYTYAGLYAYYKNSGGSIVAAANPILKMMSMSMCKTGSSCSGGSIANQVRTNFDYEAGSSGVRSNLLLVSETRENSLNSDYDSTSDPKTLFTYDDVGNPLTVDGPLAGSDDTVRYRYNAARQVTGVAGPDPDGGGALKHRAVRTIYNADGQPTYIEQGTVDSQSDGHWAAFTRLQMLENVYDIYGRKNRMKLYGTSTLEALTGYRYDAAGRLLCTAQRMNPAIWEGGLPTDDCLTGTTGSQGEDRVSRNNWNALDQVTSVESAVGTGLAQTTATSTYSANGKLATIKDTRNYKTTYEYDGFDRLVKTRYPEPTTTNSSTSDYEELTYDAGSNVTSLRKRDGNSISLTYDDMGRITYKDLPGSDPDVTLAYDLASRPVSASISGLSLSFSYDQLGRMTRQASPQGNTDYEYDLASRRTKLTWTDSFYVNYDYFVTGDLQKIRENGATSTPGLLATFEYDDLGRRTKLNRGNGTDVVYAYDSASRLYTLTENFVGTSANLTTTLTYAPSGQIATRARSNDAYAWNAAATVSRSYSTNGLNQYTAAGAITPTYTDGKANLTSAGTPVYTFDSQNRLVSATSPTATWSYDPLDRLYRTTGSATLRLGYDGDDLIAEYNDSNSLLRRYVHGPGADEPLVWYEGSGTSDRRWLHADERGSIIAVSNGSGNSTITNTYDEYGIPGTGNDGRFQFTGQTWLTDLGMYHYKARTYWAALGRFLQPDPIGYGDGLNMYAYVGNDPVSGRDPTGLTVQTNEIVVCGGSGCNPSSNPSDGIITLGLRAGGTEGPCLAIACLRDGFVTRLAVSPPVATPQSGPGCPPPPNSTYGDIAYIADLVAGATDKAALGATVLGVVTSETGVGAIGFLGAAGVLKVVSLAATGVKAGAEYLGGNSRAATATAIGAGASAVVGNGLAKGLQVNRMAGTLRLPTKLERIAPTALGTAAGTGGSAVACGVLK